VCHVFNLGFWGTSEHDVYVVRINKSNLVSLFSGVHKPQLWVNFESEV